MAFYLTFVFNLIAGHLLVSNPRLSYLKQDYWFELKVSGAEPGFFKWEGRGSHGEGGRGVTGTPGPLPLP